MFSTSRFNFFILWGNISCHICRQEMSQPSVISGLHTWMRAPKGTQCLQSRSSRCHHPHSDCSWAWGNAEKKQPSPHLPLIGWTRNEGCKQKQNLAPDSWECIWGRNSVVRLASSHTQKNAKFLGLLSALLYFTIISDVQTACLLCYKLLYSLTPSPASSGALYSGLLRCCLQSLESLTFPPNAK